MNQSAVYRSLLDQAEADLPVKRPCLQPIYRSSKRELDLVKSDVSVKRPCPHPIAAHRVQEYFSWPYYPPYYPYESRTSLAFSDQNNNHGAAQRMVELQKEAEGEAKKRGYTQQEYRICRGYLFKRKFEKSPEPLSGRLERLKKVLDQIRDTRGYGVTGDSPCSGHEELIEGEPNPIASQSLRCILGEYERSKNPWARQCVKRVEEVLLGEIREKMRKRYLCAGVVNLVETSDSYRLVTFHVHEEGTAPPAEGQPREIAEALYRTHPNPIQAKIYLTEWKIRKGEEVLFSTGDAFNSD